MIEEVRVENSFRKFFRKDSLNGKYYDYHTSNRRKPNYFDEELNHKQPSKNFLEF